MPVMECQKPGPVDPQQKLVDALSLLDATIKRVQEVRGIVAEALEGIPAYPPAPVIRPAIHELHVEARKVGLGS